MAVRHLNKRDRLAGKYRRVWQVTLSLALLLGVNLAPRHAQAFCGFYVAGADGALFNNATMVVMMRDGTRTILSMQNNYQGPAADFAMVVPVPVVLQEENVKTLSNDVFDRVDKLAAPRLVEYWEQDPCAPPIPPPMMMRAQKSGVAKPMSASPGGTLGVTVEAEFTVGEYEIVILSARDSTGLNTWLKQEKYNIPAGAEPVLKPYIAQGMKFFVARVNAEKVQFKDGQAMLSPLRFHYESKAFFLPVRLGLLNSAGAQDLIVHILAKGQRYEVANYDNVTIPTNLNVKESVKTSFGPFYTSLFDDTLKRHPKAVVTEYSWASSSCDPCPTPPLSTADLLTLGADVLPGSNPASDGPRRRMMLGNGFVLTRLHTRYSKESLGEDLVFRAAPPIAGGREFLSEGEHLEKGAVSAGTNNFQGRYAMRHPWTGPVACEKPRRGIWGGPPAGAKPTPVAAQDLAFAKRGAQLTSFVEKEQKLVSYFSAGNPLGMPVPSLEMIPEAAGTGTVSEGQLPESSRADAAPTAAATSPTAVPPSVEPRTSGCGRCAVDGRTKRLSAWPFALLLLLGAGRVRRRPRRPC